MLIEPGKFYQSKIENVFHIDGGKMPIFFGRMLEVGEAYFVKDALYFFSFNGHFLDRKSAWHGDVITEGRDSFLAANHAYDICEEYLPVFHIEGIIPQWKKVLEALRRLEE